VTERAAPECGSYAVEAGPAAPAHGTYSGYQWEKRRGVICPDCRRAARDYQRRLRATAAGRRDSWIVSRAQGRALTELAGEYRERYRELYEKHRDALAAEAGGSMARAGDGRC